MSESELLINDKVQTFLVSFSILEGRHYIWANANTCVIVKLGNKKKKTAVKYGTDNPLYNEVYQPKALCKHHKILGAIAFDLNFVWVQPDHLFYHRWAVLRSTKHESVRVFRGYLKVDISISFRGQIPKLPINVQNNDIDGNLLVQEEGILERQTALFIFDIYKCINLTYKPSNKINVPKKKCKGVECGPNTFIRVYFAAQSVKTRHFFNNKNPAINQRLILRDTYPTVAQRIKLEVHYSDDRTHLPHASYNVNLKYISNASEDGFLPLFGPTFVHLYTKKNMQGYAGSVLMEMKTEIKDIMLVDAAMKQREIPRELYENLKSPVEPIYLFVLITDITIIPKKFTSMPISFMVSHGNENVLWDQFFVQRQNRILKRLNSKYFHINLENKMPCFHITSEWNNFQRRMYNSNMLDKIVNKLKSYVKEIENLLQEKDYVGVENIVDESLQYLATAAVKYLDIIQRYNLEEGTKLEQGRMKLCVKEMTDITQNANLIPTDANRKSDFKALLKKLKVLERLVEEAQYCWPDPFIWMIVKNKKISGVQIKARDIVFSALEEESGESYKIEQTIFLTKSILNSSNNFTCKLRVKFWLGTEAQRDHVKDIIPEGYIFAEDKKEPKYLVANESHTFQCKAHIFQGKVRPGYDRSGLADCYVLVYIKDKWNKTKTITQSLNPMWDQTLVFSNLVLYGSKSYIKNNPPDIFVELIDKDRIGANDFIGRNVVRPTVKLKEEPYGPPFFPPKLSWLSVFDAHEQNAEILSAFELLETSNDEIEDFKTEAREIKPFSTKIPVDIKPTFQSYRIEVCFWGVRNLKSVSEIQIRKPRISVIMQDVILNSETGNVDKALNFRDCVKTCDLFLPDQEEYSPPLRVKMFDNRQFGIYVFAGIFISKVQPFIIHLMSAEKRKNLLDNINRISDDFVKSDDTIKDQTRKVKNVIIQILSEQTLKSESISKEVKNPEERINPIGFLKDRVGSFIGAIREIRKQSKSSEKTPTKPKRLSVLLTREETDYVDTDDFDWWTKFYASEKEKPKDITQYIVPVMERIKLKIYPNELEKQPEFKGFTDTLFPFEIFKGRRTGDHALDDTKITGVFKGNIKVYRWPPEEGNADCVTASGVNVNDGGIFQDLPRNLPLKFVARIYVVQALNLRPKDVLGTADPYIRVMFNKEVVEDKQIYIANKSNPIFGRCFEFQGTFPEDNTVTIEVWDWDRLSKDDLIGKTVIDIENRFYTKYRACCGISEVYQKSGYCQWRDIMTPATILKNLCHLYHLETPVYTETSVRIGAKLFRVDESMCRSDQFENNQVLALAALGRWKEMPVVGFSLVPEHVETRSLFHPSKPGIEQGKIQMWIDLLQYKEDRPLPEAVDITPRKPKAYELRVIIWNTQDVKLTEDDFFTGEKKSDIYVKGWLSGAEDAQCTDVHYRSLTGEGNFNWRFIFPFEYLSTENQMVFKKKAMIYSRVETEFKTPCRLTLQVWDNDTLLPDDFLGDININMIQPQQDMRPVRAKSTISRTMTLELANLPKGSPSPHKCNLSIFDPMARTVNLFKIKRTKGWWPFYDRDEKTRENFLTGKVEAELEIFLLDDAIAQPAGMGRDEPQSLPPPNRPDISFSLFRNPFKALKYVFRMKCRKFLFYILIVLGFIFLGLWLYSIPSKLVTKIIGI